MNARLRGEVDDEGDTGEDEDADEARPSQGLDGGAGRGRSIELRSVSEQMSDALREAAGGLPGTYGED